MYNQKTSVQPHIIHMNMVQTFPTCDIICLHYDGHIQLANCSLFPYTFSAACDTECPYYNSYVRCYSQQIIVGSHFVHMKHCVVASVKLAKNHSIGEM